MHIVYNNSLSLIHFVCAKTPHLHIIKFVICSFCLIQTNISFLWRAHTAQCIDSAAVSSRVLPSQHQKGGPLLHLELPSLFSRTMVVSLSDFMDGPIALWMLLEHILHCQNKVHDKFINSLLKDIGIECL